MSSTTNKKLVWDLPVRLFHWLLVAGIGGLWYTGETGYENTHMKIGYCIIGLLIFRVLWAIFGTKHSRIASFFPTPKSLVSSVKGLFDKDAAYYVGHNPLGAVSAIVMLVLVGLQAVTGLFTKGEIWYGPYTSALSSSLVKKLDGIHHVNFNYILIAAGVHIFAIFFYLFYKKQNLITPMITGKKKEDVVPEGSQISGSRIWLAIVLAVLVAAFTYWLVMIAPPPVVYDDYY